MSLVVTEVMAAQGVAWPDAHGDEDAMLRLAIAMQEATGFDNLALPFCMTVEAEACGAKVDLGSATIQPRVRGFLLPSDGKGELRKPGLRSGRAGVLLKALRRAKALRPDLALIGNLVGPFSLLGMLADPLQVLRWTRRNPQALHAHLRTICESLFEFGRLQKEAGVDVICIAEPTATGEILGGPPFRAFALPCLNSLARRLRALGLKIIVHICGDVRAIENELSALEADAMSFDSMVDIVSLAGRAPRWRVMGNVDAFLLRQGPADAVRKRCRRLLEGGVRLLAPACGVIPTTPVSHLKAMRAALQAKD
jgi:[methyl-Co(III) methanol-specific corrinoid protein]:coenzyme M methyltransferase